MNGGSSNAVSSIAAPSSTHNQGRALTDRRAHAEIETANSEKGAVHLEVDDAQAAINAAGSKIAAARSKIDAAIEARAAFEFGLQ